MQSSGSTARAFRAALIAGIIVTVVGQEAEPALSSPNSLIQSLPADSQTRETLQTAIKTRDYAKAEDLLAGLATKDPKSQPILLTLANVLFLDGKQLNCVVVLKKAELLGPLDERDRFLLALSYVSLGRRNLAMAELQSLEQSSPASAIYPYWLSRLAYRKMNLQLALTYAERAVRLDPAFMKAYDQLGLCYAGLNQNEAAIQAYKQAIRLNQEQSLNWPWPSMNLGTLLRRMERLDEAEAQLRDSIAIDPRFPTAHLRLGQVLEKKEQLPEAESELKEAARLDPTCPDPHYTLARIYRNRQDAVSAAKEIKLFQELRDADTRKGITRPD